MTILPIVLYPHPALKKVAEPVTDVNADIRQLMDDMTETMVNARGVGLAANQVGVLKRVIIIHCDQDAAPIKMANPEIVWHSDKRIAGNEGCLSVPQVFTDVERYARVRVRYLDEHGHTQEIEGSDLLGACLQHEIDHLDGIMFPDRVSKLRASMCWKKFKKLQKFYEAELGYPFTWGQ